MNWIIGRYGWTVPLIAALLVILGTAYLDRQLVKELESERREASADADRRAAAFSDEIGNAISKRIGALTAAKIPFTQLEDSVTQRSFMVAVDSVTRNLQGLNAISIVNPATRRVVHGPGALLERHGVGIDSDTSILHAFERAVRSKSESATGVIEFPNGRRIIIFEPYVRGDTASGEIAGLLAAELDPTLIVRASLASSVLDSLGAVPYLVYGPRGERINNSVIPAGWSAVDRSIKVADSEWRLRVGYPPVDEGVFRVQRVATWIAGLIIALALAATLTLLRQTIRTQREEIGLRRAAEQEARRSAEEARERAREARDLTTQLEAAQRASQQLSTSLDPDDVVELFLGGVAEALGADVASLYTFEEEGELVVGRRRMIFREAAPIVERLRGDDIRQVRAPVALLPTLAEAVATGEPYVVTGDDDGMRTLTGGISAGPDAPQGSVTIPLLIGGHMVGVASWELYGEIRSFDSGTIAFAQALAAPAAAALRTAELFASLEMARERATNEALRFGTVLDQMADGVAVVDASGRVERYNKAAEELLGQELAKVPLSDWTSRLGITTVDGRPYGAGDFPLMRALRGERVRRATFIARSPWGGERFLSCSTGPIQSESGDITGAAIVFRDVTDEQQYAEILRHTNRELRQQAEMMEEVNRQLREATKAKDQFLAVMSHELRTPINAIMGYSDLLDLGVKGDLTPDQRLMVNRVRDTSRHLLGLINEVLDLAKIGAGRVDLVLVELEVPPIVERCVQQIMPLASAKGLNINVHAVPRDDSSPVTVLADDTRLTQILINLLSNAVKFTHDGGVDVTFSQSEDLVQIRVKDSGVGIEPDQVERIFEEFYQVESGFSRSSGGTGLGLAITRRFTRLMGGDIRVQSEVGNGSEFIVELPSAQSQGDAEDKRSEPRLVLLTQDEGTVSALSASLAGVARVSHASEPPRLAALARRERPDIVALDTRAPEHAAWRALSVLQSDRGTSDALTVLLVFSDRDPDRAAALGPFVTLTKPIALESAIATLQRIARPGGGGVLVADDDPDVARIIGDALSASGLPVETVTTGTELLRRLDRVAPAALVLDLLMPGLDAVNVLARLRSEQSLREVPVVLLAPRELSGAETERLGRSINAAGRNDLLEFMPLQAVLDRVIERPATASGVTVH